MKYIALTFSDEKYIKTRAKYVAEMASKNIFSKIFSYGPEDFDSKFLECHQKFILNNPRGYGYWIWKPYLILKVLRDLEEGDILVYGDAGNEMKGTTQECLQKFDLVKGINGTKIIATDASRNYLYTKTDLFFRIRWYALLYAYNIMPHANRIVIQKNIRTVNFVTEWLNFCTSDYRNIDDSPSILPKLPHFREHRHDQSVFSLLFSLYKCKIVSFGNVWVNSRLRF